MVGISVRILCGKIDVKSVMKNISVYIKNVSMEDANIFVFTAKEREFVIIIDEGTDAESVSETKTNVPTIF